MEDKAMKANVFYRYENREYTLAEREQLGGVFGWCDLEYAEEIVKEKFEEWGFGMGFHVLSYPFIEGRDFLEFNELSLHDLE